MKFMSIGENCQVAGQLRRAINIKTTYFDNLVTPHDGLLKSLRRGIYKLMRPDDFEIGSWEGRPSARERETGVYFHHEFFDEHGSAKQVDLDIARHIGQVNEKFKFLSDRLLTIARNSGKKCFVRREYNGSDLSPDANVAVHEALADLGAKNFFILNVHNNPDYPGLVVERDIRFYYVPNLPNVDWMGNDAGWSNAILSAAADARVLR